MNTQHKLQPFNRRLIVEWGKWLSSKEWKLWCTFTTHYPLKLKKARFLLEDLCNLIQLRDDETPTIFWVAEPFAGSSNYHLHALINMDCSTEKAIQLIKQAWLTVCKPSGHGKFNKAHCEKYEATKGASYYVAKYINTPVVDYDFISPIRPQLE